MRKKVIQLLYYNKFLKFLLPLYHLLFGRNVIKRKGTGTNNKVMTSTANLIHDTFYFRSGSDNILEVGDGTSLEYSQITFNGNNNHVSIGKNGFLNGLDITLEGDNNNILIGNNAFVMGDTRIYVVDGSMLSIGEGCMFSDRIEIRTTDNHSIIDKKTGKRINPEENVIIHDKVWIGTGVIILKGTEIAEGCVVGAASLVTRKHLRDHVIIAGNPGREIRDNVDWKMERI